LLQNFNPANGAVTYTPAHGYSGSDGFTFGANDGRLNSAPANVALSILPLPDLDTDDLPDTWEATYGLTDPLADDDSDGMNNLAEYLANTNPTNATSFLRITGFSQNGSGHSTLTWNAIGGTRYRVSFTDVISAPFTDVVRPASLEINSATIGTSTTQSFTDNFTLTGGAPANGRRFYRIRIVQ
jgi:hypothetical protein